MTWAKNQNTKFGPPPWLAQVNHKASHRGMGRPPCRYYFFSWFSVQNHNADPHVVLHAGRRWSLRFRSLITVFQHQVLHTFYPSVVGVEAWDQIPSLSTQGQKLLLVFLTHFYGGFQAVSYESGREGQYPLSTLSSQLINDIIGVGLDPRVL